MAAGFHDAPIHHQQGTLGDEVPAVVNGVSYDVQEGAGLCQNNVDHSDCRMPQAETNELVDISRVEMILVDNSRGGVVVDNNHGGVVVDDSHVDVVVCVEQQVMDVEQQVMDVEQ